MLSELNRFSPLRVLDTSRGHVLEPGQLGVVMGRRGNGKTTCLVQIGLDHLLRGRQVAHVTLDRSVRRVRDGYDEALKELADVWAPLDFTIESRIDMERRRHIFSYQHRPFSPDHLARQLELMAAYQDFEPGLVIIDGFDLPGAAREPTGAIGALKAMVGERRAGVWLAGRTDRANVPADLKGLPVPYQALEDVIDVALYISAADRKGNAQLKVLKASQEVGEGQADLDPRTLLLRPR